MKMSHILLAKIKQLFCNHLYITRDFSGQWRTCYKCHKTKFFNGKENTYIKYTIRLLLCRLYYRHDLMPDIEGYYLGCYKCRVNKKWRH
jgi:hypothetical protein